MESHKNDLNVLFAYARLDQTDKMKKIIEERKLDINVTDDKGRTILHNASLKGCYQTVSYLLYSGANIDPEVMCDDGATPLVYAVKYGHSSVVEILIEQGANVHVTVGGLNLFDIAIKSNTYKVIDLLLQKGFDIDQVNNLVGATPLIIAIVEHKHESLKFLLEKGADYKKPGCSGEHPLCYAVRKRECAECIEMLLRHVEKKEGKEGLLLYMNSRSSDRGRNPLHLACSLGNYEAIKVLIRYGADSKVEDMEGYKPYDLLEDLEGSNALREVRRLLEKPNQHMR